MKEIIKKVKSLEIGKFLIKDTPNLVIIGNGESRRNLPVETLQKYNCLIGACNAWYRDHEGFVIGMVDKRMVREVLLSDRLQMNYYIILKASIDVLKNQSKASMRDKRIRKEAMAASAIYSSNTNLFFKADDYLSKAHVSKRDTGILTLKVLLVLNPQIKNLFLLGFDFGVSVGLRRNNMYLGTQNYATSNSKIKDTKLRRQIDTSSKLLVQYSQVKVRRIACFEPSTYKLKFDGGRVIPNISWVDFIREIQ